MNHDIKVGAPALHEAVLDDAHDLRLKAVDRLGQSRYRGPPLPTACREITGVWEYLGPPDSRGHAQLLYRSLGYGLSFGLELELGA